MKRKADRIDKMNKIRVSSCRIPRDLDTCQDGFAPSSLFDSLNDHSLANEF